MKLRTSLIVFCVTALFAVTAQAKPHKASADTQDTIQTVYLWPDGVPADSGPAPQGPEKVVTTIDDYGVVLNISKPRMIVMHPEHPNGTAVLILGGGGYLHIQIGAEVIPTAEWLMTLGVTPVILYYRLPGDGWAPVAPFQDTQRAMRLLRAHADAFGINPHRIGVLGYSAGGNLAGIIATRFKHDFYPPTDAADKQPSRPDFAGLIYPVSSITPPYDNTNTRQRLLPQDNAQQAYTVQNHVSDATPPTFIAQAEDDPVVNVQSNMALYQLLVEHGVPAELHLFEHGGHGWGLGLPGTEVSQWPMLFAAWMRLHGWLPCPTDKAAPTR
ncbi:MAG TPA: alpha/beta hydrolase [Oleiagrimonas sp.]|nr:alpha/beta hydrolase [Oleiagrimonas sp.]